MLNRLGVFAARYHRAVLIVSALLFVVVTILGIGAFTRLLSGGFCQCFCLVFWGRGAGCFAFRR